MDAREGEPRAPEVRHIRACEEDGSTTSRISSDYCFCKYNLDALFCVLGCLMLVSFVSKVRIFSTESSRVR